MLLLIENRHHKTSRDPSEFRKLRNSLYVLSFRTQLWFAIDLAGKPNESSLFVSVRHCWIVSCDLPNEKGWAVWTRLLYFLRNLPPLLWVQSLKGTYFLRYWIFNRFQWRVFVHQRFLSLVEKAWSNSLNMIYQFCRNVVFFLCIQEALHHMRFVRFDD